MTNYIRDAACRGRRPQGVIPLRHHSRPHLVNQLLAERRTPRFLVAPGGFGKKTLMAEYADVVFSFEHVYWVSGASPCFLRDLDAGTIATDLCHHDQGVRLVVFQDVPCMDEQRVAAFGRLVEDLSASDIEVMCSMAPSADLYEGLLPGRVVVNGYDLLVGEEERAPRLADEDDVAADGLPPSACVPCVLWDERGAQLLLEGLRKEDIPQELFLVTAVILLIGAGSLDDLEQFVEPGHLPEALGLLAACYPYAGISLEEGRFEASPVKVEEFSRIIGTVLNGNCGQSPCKGRDEVAAAAADVMLARHCSDRAFETMDYLASRSAVMRWLGKHSWAMVKNGYSREYCVAFLQANRSHSTVPHAASSAAAWGFAEMGDAKEAQRLARAVVTSATSDDTSRSMAALLLAMIGKGDSLVRADEAMDHLMRKALALRKNGQDAVVPLEAMDAMAVQAALQDGPTLAISVFREQCRRSGEAGRRLWGEPLLLSAALILGFLQNRQPDIGPLSIEDREEVEDFIQECILALDALATNGVHFSWDHVRMADLLQGLMDSRQFGVKMRLRPMTVSALGRARGDLALEQGAYRRSCRQMDAERQARGDARPDGFRSAAARHQKMSAAKVSVVPHLRVEMFGSFVVYVGDRRVDDKLLARRKSRTLLALLVLNHGREVSVDYLSATFWPNAAPASARKNFYTLWSLLRRVLSVEGQCPYLVRTEMSVRVNYDLVDSDLEPFEELCRQLLFSGRSDTNWEELLALASGRFGGVLLPAERENVVIQESRHRLHTNITDALVTASGRLLAGGQPQGALWFAREALRRDQSREDVYLAQMRAQIAAEQRAAALDTFFACRSYLTEQLGIDPSPRLVELYHSIIEEEVAL